MEAAGTPLQEDARIVGAGVVRAVGVVAALVGAVGTIYVGGGAIVWLRLAVAGRQR